MGGYRESSSRTSRLPRWLRLLGVLALFVGVIAALSALSVALAHHRGPMRLRVLAVVWMIGSFGLLFLAAKAWFIFKEPDELADW